MSGEPFAASLVRAARPRQWTKNLAVFAPLLFAKSVFVPGAAVRASLAVLAYCLLSAGVYALNDTLDRDRDRLHPLKRLRPIAQGLVTPAQAIALTTGCWAVGLSIAFGLGRPFLATAAAYLGLQLAYSLRLKQVVILDVLLIAVGFVIRVVGGGVVIGVPVSNWLYLCALLLAVFLGFAKRRHELSSLAHDAGGHRQNLTEYSVPMLDQMISVVAAACVVAYGLYTVSAETQAKVGSDGLKYTVPLVLYGIFRYLFLVHKRGEGGSPERVLLSDPPFIANLGLFLAVASYVLYS